MKKILSFILFFCQHLCTVLAIIISIYLLYRWNMAREANPAEQNPFNPWWPGLVLVSLGFVFGLARKGLEFDQGLGSKGRAQIEKSPDRTPEVRDKDKTTTANVTTHTSGTERVPVNSIQTTTTEIEKQVDKQSNSFLHAVRGTRAAIVVFHSVWNLNGHWRGSPSAGCRRRSWSR